MRVFFYVIGRVVNDAPEYQFTPLYLLTGTVVLMTASAKRYWYSSYLQAGVHYLEVKVGGNAWIHSSTGWPIQFRWSCSVRTLSTREDSTNCSTGTRSVGELCFYIWDNDKRSSTLHVVVPPCLSQWCLYDDAEVAYHPGNEGCGRGKTNRMDAQPRTGLLSASVHAEISISTSETIFSMWMRNM